MTNIKAAAMITRRGLPRIAVFGTRQSMVTPVTFSALDARLTLTADKADGPVTIDPLALAAREALPAFADDGVITIGEADDEVVRIGRLGRANDLFQCGIRVAIANVLGDGAVEQVWLLQHHAHLPPQPLHVIVADVDAIDRSTKTTFRT